MSAADATAGVVTGAASAPWRRLSTRFLRSELGLVFGRRRNQVALAILAAVPVIIAVAVWWSAPPSGRGPNLIGAVSGNGVYVALAALGAELGLFLPLAVAAVASDAIAGEANQGTLRYLLTVPVGRARLLAVKYAGVLAYALAATLLVAAVGVAVGVAFFGGGEMILLSGSQIGFLPALGRVALICGYITACLAAVGALGLFVSTLTEQPVGAAIAVVVFTISNQILGTIPQLEPIHPYLMTHWWYGFGDLLRAPIATSSVGPGLLSAGIYTAVFLAAAWARLGSRDITS
ncbi:MAG: ABC transporter permease subunit [Micromonosporaceae bacterium]|nr:ABC transporter permease subunit [Micromonosporaceae bacterium]